MYTKGFKDPGPWFYQFLKTVHRLCHLTLVSLRIKTTTFLQFQNKPKSSPFIHNWWYTIKKSCGLFHLFCRKTPHKLSLAGTTLRLRFLLESSMCVAFFWSNKKKERSVEWSLAFTSFSPGSFVAAQGKAEHHSPCF